MATKLTGMDGGMVTTAGDTGTLITDGSLVIGNADTDNITVNAEFISPLVPNQADTYDLGSPDNCWKDLHIGNRINLHGTTFGTALTFVDPAADALITIPGTTGTLALEGLLPSYLAFGKNNAQNAPLTNFELSTVNGSANARGWRLPVAGFVTHMSCQFDATASGGTNSFVLTLWKEGVEQVNYRITLNNVPTGETGASVAFPTPLQFSANETMTLKLSMTKGEFDSFSMADLACLLRILN